MFDSKDIGNGPSVKKKLQAHLLITHGFLNNKKIELDLNNKYHFFFLGNDL